jgi:hypothetical protein
VHRGCTPEYKLAQHTVLACEGGRRAQGLYSRVQTGSAQLVKVSEGPGVVLQSTSWLSTGHLGESVGTSRDDNIEPPMIAVV